MKRHWIAFLGLLLVDSAQADGTKPSSPELPIPTVPAAIDPRTRATPSPKPNAEAAALLVEPGVNQMVQVAVNHINRILTPFQDPEIWTADADADAIQRRGNVIYIAPRSERLISMFVTEKGDEGQALSLTLVPMRIPPREIRLRLAGTSGMAVGIKARAVGSAEKWETTQPYVETLKTLLRKLALGEVPPGYEIGDKPRSVRAPGCAVRSSWTLDFAQGQYLLGARFEVLIGVATNRAAEARAFEEGWCADAGVAAVALWPSALVEPNEAAELMVVRRLDLPTATERERPSLLKAKRGG